MSVYYYYYLPHRLSRPPLYPSTKGIWRVFIIVRVINVWHVFFANREKLPGERRSVSMVSTVFTRLEHGQARVLRFLAHCAASGMCVVGLYSILIMLSECVGCLVEVLIFTLMGVIVNAGSLLKFVALAIMLVAYSYDCFNNVEKKYLKLNKALFSEVN